MRRSPGPLPALARAAKVQRRAAGEGFDFRSAGAAVEQGPGRARRAGCRDRRPRPRTAPPDTEAPPQRVEEELGDLLFAVTALGRRLNVDPETALRKATNDSPIASNG